jgi:excisionase family DNA binding protein
MSWAKYATASAERHSRSHTTAANRPGQITAGDLTEVDEQLLISVPSMAKRLSIGKTQAWSIVARHEVRVVRIGRSTRVLKDSVDEWAMARASARIAEPADLVLER